MNVNNLNLGEHVKFNVKKRFGIITLNRPEKANALTLEMLKDLKKAIDHCQQAENIRGILLTGNGNSFTTGMDMRSIDASNHEMAFEYERIASEIAFSLFSGKPVICAINGKAMGDGVAYALCSDYRLAIKETYFQMPEIKTGIFPGAGTIVIMTRVLGIPWTKRILMFAEKIPAEKALEIGLIDCIVDSKEELIKVALEKARFLFTKNQVVLNGIKLCTNYLIDKSISKGYELEKQFLKDWIEGGKKKDHVEYFREKIISL